METKQGGLAGVKAGESSICLCGSKEESLLYFGYPIEELAERATFEEVLYLLTRGEKGGKEEIDHYKRTLQELRQLPPHISLWMQQLPQDCEPMDVLRTGVSLLGCWSAKESGIHHNQDLVASALPSLLLCWYKGDDALYSEQDSMAGYFLDMLKKKEPKEYEKRALDVALILYAEHEFNASTFTVRTIASTLSDYFSAILGGIGALKGPLHGGANEKAWHLIQKFSTPDEAEQKVLDLLVSKQLVWGFGHRVYKSKDPRSDIMKNIAKNLSLKHDEGHFFPIAERIEKVMWEEKKLCTNLDFYGALVFHFLGIPPSLFTPIFVMSRIAGWSAHFQEQQENNRLIRPLCEYIGTKKRSW